MATGLSAERTHIQFHELVSNDLGRENIYVYQNEVSLGTRTVPSRWVKPCRPISLKLGFYYNMN